ncbi:cell division protein FtsQ/DivIB [Candidatus Protochlamydia amoebophila]|uniref:cell division protein FtsQ/DivIB n=1 Tax=Candidatus Protochlamydia amoebophila TaxID=362787 RepID=UPI001BC95A19|nr:hypothetical protein [Candidatus Protochlamydia amoebophila]
MVSKSYPNPEIPFKRACLWILLSSLLISGSALMGWLYYQSAKEKRLRGGQYQIVAIVQETPHQESLKTGYLAELLELSLDQPANLYLFDSFEGEKKLLKSPLIKKVSIKKIRPGTLYIQYEMRSPIAYVGDYSNTAIDEDGILFPFRPFFTPKSIPTFYLGLSEHEGKWGVALQNVDRLQLARNVLKIFKEVATREIAVKQIDVAEAYADSYGQRQIVVKLEDRKDFLSRHISAETLLRLNPEHYKQNIVNFFSLDKVLNVKSKINNGMTIIDLRIPHLAFYSQDEK